MKTTKLVPMTMQSACSRVLTTHPHTQSLPALRYEAILKKIRDSSSAAFGDSDDDDDDDDVNDDAPIDSVDCVAQVSCLLRGWRVSYGGLAFKVSFVLFYCVCFALLEQESQLIN